MVSEKNELKAPKYGAKKCKDLLILKVQVGDEGGHTDFQSIGSLPSWSWTRAGPRWHYKPNACLPHGWQRFNMYRLFCCFSQMVNRELVFVCDASLQSSNATMLLCHSSGSSAKTSKIPCIAFFITVFVKFLKILCICNFSFSATKWILNHFYKNLKYPHVCAHNAMRAFKELGCM